MRLVGYLKINKILYLWLVLQFVKIFRLFVKIEQRQWRFSLRRAYSDGTSSSLLVPTVETDSGLLYRADDLNIAGEHDQL